ncbi:MAG TPA: SGNH/GDSL hydrolase family protein [Xanthomonadaceae bacterium]|nr:SGNH/GDSL hydrolase family protein [Xanthomonadaceae bacterium]
MPTLDADTLGPYRKPWLLPLLLVQGALVRMRALRLPEADGPRDGLVQGEREGEPYRVLVLGDSAAAGVGVARQDQALGPALARAIHRVKGRSVAWRVLARTGLNAQQVAADLLPKLDGANGEARADLVVTSIGVNDAVGLTRSADFAAAMEAIVHGLRAYAGGSARIVLGRVPPLHRSPLFRDPLRGLVAWRIDRINALLAEIAARHAGVILAGEPALLSARDLAEDGFHPNASSYPAWADYLVDHHLG